MPKGIRKSPARPPSTSTSTPRTEPMRPSAPSFQVTATFRASSAQLVTLFQNLPHLLEDIRVTRDDDVAERVDEVTFPRGTVIGDALAEAPPPALKAAPSRSRQASRPAEGAGGQWTTAAQLAKAENFRKKYGSDVVLESAKNGYPKLAIDANLKRIGKTRGEITDNSWPVGSIEASLKKAMSNSTP